MSIIHDIKYAEEEYSAKFGDEGAILMVWLDVRGMSGFRVDGVPVTDFITDEFKDRLFDVWRAHQDMRVVDLAERRNDDKSNEPPGAA